MSWEPHEMAACRPDAHDQAGSKEELDPRAAGDGPRFLGTANGDRYVIRQPRPKQENIAFRMHPEHWLSQHQGKGHAQNVQSGQLRNWTAANGRQRRSAAICACRHCGSATHGDRLASDHYSRP
jgi:hypothetical protein